MNAHKVGCSKTQFPHRNIKQKQKQKQQQKKLSKTVRINFVKSLENSQIFTKVKETLNQEKGNSKITGKFVAFLLAITPIPSWSWWQSLSQVPAFEVWF